MRHNDPIEDSQNDTLPPEISEALSKSLSNLKLEKQIEDAQRNFQRYVPTADILNQGFATRLIRWMIEYILCMPLAVVHAVRDSVKPSRERLKAPVWQIVVAINFPISIVMSLFVALTSFWTIVVTGRLSLINKDVAIAHLKDMVRVRDDSLKKGFPESGL